jgi:hypothetical protein
VNKTLKLCFCDRICGLDATSQDRKRLISFKEDAVFLWTFNGKTVQKANKPSDPTGMAVSEDDNVILTVLNDHFIIVLDYLGNVILEKNIADLGVCYPFSVTFDSTGILWIGGSIACAIFRFLSYLTYLSYMFKVIKTYSYLAGQQLLFQ